MPTMMRMTMGSSLRLRAQPAGCARRFEFRYAELSHPCRISVEYRRGVRDCGTRAGLGYAVLGIVRWCIVSVITRELHISLR